MPRTLTRDEQDTFRAELCTAATALFVESGWSAVTMRALAERLGCSRMTPYRYFDDKADIMATVRRAGFVRLAERLEAMEAGSDPTARVASLAQGYVEFAKNEPSIYGLMFEVEQLEPGLDASLDSAINRSRAPVLAAAHAAVESGDLAGDPVELAHVFWAGLHGLIELHLNDRVRLGMDLDALTAAMVSTLLDGCRAPSDR